MPLLTRLGLAVSCAALLCTTLIGPALAASDLADRAAEKAQARERRFEQKRGDEIAATALQYVGLPYRWGGASPASGFDCSGFVMYVFGTIGLSLPHDQRGQLASGRQIPADELAPGDLLIFQNTYRRGPSHSGIYLGDNQFVHAANEQTGVIVSQLWGSYWGAHYLDAARPGR